MDDLYCVISIIAGLDSKLGKASKKKGGTSIQSWMKGILNHVYWIASKSGMQTKEEHEKIIVIFLL